VGSTLRSTQAALRDRSSDAAAQDETEQRGDGRPDCWLDAMAVVRAAAGDAATAAFLAQPPVHVTAGGRSQKRTNNGRASGSSRGRQQRRRRPDPPPVTLRRIDNAELVEVVSADGFARRKVGGRVGALPVLARPRSVGGAPAARAPTRRNDHRAGLHARPLVVRPRRSRHRADDHGGDGDLRAAA
jgi:hypothetical protein